MSQIVNGAKYLKFKQVAYTYIICSCALDLVDMELKRRFFSAPILEIYSYSILDENWN